MSHVEVFLTEVDLRESIDRVIFQLGYQIRSTRSEIKIIGEIPSVQADPEIVDQVLCNLLENAIKFSAPDSIPKIIVRAEILRDTVRLCIQDSGIGVPIQYHERIFRPFEQLHAADIYGGTGIGLALVKEGVERMGGRVGVESQPAIGSTFWIELPKATQSGAMQNDDLRLGAAGLSESAETHTASPAEIL